MEIHIWSRVYKIEYSYKRRSDIRGSCVFLHQGSLLLLGMISLTIAGITVGNGFIEWIMVLIFYQGLKRIHSFDIVQNIHMYA